MKKHNAPPKIKAIYKETIDSFNNVNHILCTAGLRATIEAICMEEDIKGGKVKKEPEKEDSEKVFRKTLQGKISGLAEKRILTRTHFEVLHEHRFLGNDALHEIEKPSEEELEIAIDIIEHTIENLYALTEKINKLKYKKSKRKNKTNT